VNYLNYGLEVRAANTGQTTLLPTGVSAEQEPFSAAH
jgi:hypothetical protein